MPAPSEVSFEMAGYSAVTPHTFSTDIPHYDDTLRKYSIEVQKYSAAT